MKRLASGCLLLSATSAWAGIAFTIENDFLSGSDSTYTHGAELAWFDQNGKGIYFTGVRNKFYTPEDTRIAENQPDDRPWAGLLTAFFEQGIIRNKLHAKYGIEIGVLGPAAMAEEQQKWFHEMIGAHEPQGWDNQLDNEPILNPYIDNWYELGTLGDARQWSVMPDVVFGGVCGTANVNAYSGVRIRAGYNTPPLWPTGKKADLSTARNKFFIYGLAEVKGLVVAHDATFGRSLFNGVDEDHHVDLNPLVGEARGGVCLGYDWFSVAYQVIVRTDEFEEQDGTTVWGLVCLEVGCPF